jgi:hypothetical protein
MKKIIYILFVFAVGVFVTACDGDLLDKTPQDQISDPDFWKTEGDLELYLNGLYSGLPGWGGSGAAPSPDLGTDIVIESGEWWGDSFTPRLDGTLSIPASGGGWNWGPVRNINYFLENAGRAESGELIDHYIGEGYFFRAWYYFDLLKQFGDLPIITQVVNVEDEDILYSARSSRSDVVDFIIDDLDMAISKMEFASQVGASRLNKDIALLFKARVCLYEGTWEKYHNGTEFAGDTDGSGYLTQAAAAANSVITNGNYSIAMGDPETAYYELFAQTDYSSNPEVMFYKHYDANTYGIGNSMWNHPNTQGMTHGMTKNYLCTDGQPIAVSGLFVGDETLDVIQVNRDPRLAQTVIVTGELDYVSLTGDSVYYGVPYMVRCPTGYALEKWRTKWLDPLRNGRTFDIGYIYFRYAEALLIYAEAKAELGTLDQSDVDLTINQLRARVGMPPLVLGAITPDPDWPDYGYALPDYLYEIRRERVVEMFAEGLRFDDLMRWRAHSLYIGTRPIGTTYTDEIKAEYPNEKVNDDGYLDPFRDYLNGGVYGFDPGRDYLKPLPTNELTINDKLGQNPGWE